MYIDTDYGTDFAPYLESSISPSATTLRLSLGTPPLTASPTATSSATASPVLTPKSDLLSPKDDSARDILSTPSNLLVDALFSELYPEVTLLSPNIDGESTPPKKKARYFPKSDHEPKLSPAPPAVVSIPPARASELPRAQVKKKPARKRTTAASAKVAKRKAPPPKASVRFCFVSVAHDAENDAEGTVEITEHMEENDTDADAFEHGPSELPPRPYPGGKYAISGLQLPPKAGKIPASVLDFLPILESRFSRLEYAIQRYADLCSERALCNSILPKLDHSSTT